jgi:hypothetical protein
LEEKAMKESMQIGVEYGAGRFRAVVTIVGSKQQFAGWRGSEAEAEADCEFVSCLAKALLQSTGIVTVEEERPQWPDVGKVH